jgi:hypothetical protein
MITDATRAGETGLLVHPRPDLGAIVVTGNDRVKWLNGLVTCDLSIRKPGEGAYGLAVGKTGRILAELWFLIGGDRVIVVLSRDRIEGFRAHLDKHLIMEDAEVEAPDREVVFTHGPLSREAVASARAASADAAMVDWTGRREAAVILAPEGGLDAVRAAILAGPGDRAACGDEAWEALRVAWGVPRFGADFDDQTLPQEASLERLAVSFSKGCYLGQETVFMLEKRGHAKKRLMRLRAEGEALAGGAEITMPDGEAVGQVTSAAPPRDGAAAALGYVKYKHANAGTAVLVGGRPATIVGLAADPLPAPTG